MENKNDKLLSDFFESNKSEIQNNGFSDRVLNQLPQKKVKNTEWIVPVFTLLGMLVSLALIDLEKVLTEFYYFVYKFYTLLCWSNKWFRLYFFFFFYWEESQFINFL